MQKEKGYNPGYSITAAYQDSTTKVKVMHNSHGFV